MQSNKNVNEQWILSQLIGIKMLEQELATALHKPSASGPSSQGKQQLRTRIRQLNAWVEAVDHSLSLAAARS